LEGDCEIFPFLSYFLQFKLLNTKSEIFFRTPKFGQLLKIFLSQMDMSKSLAGTKPTVNEDDMKKLDKFTLDFGQEG
jgi:hypothetical protein